MPVTRQSLARIIGTIGVRPWRCKSAEKLLREQQLSQTLKRAELFSPICLERGPSNLISDFGSCVALARSAA